MKTKERNLEEKKNLDVRLNRITGQIRGIKNMLKDDRYCGDILIQLAAIDKAVKSIATIILEEHLEKCVVEEIRNGNDEIINELIKLFNQF